MALRRLTTGEMISVSSPWVTEGFDERTALLAIEDTRPVLRRIERAHQALLDAQPKMLPPLALASLEAEAASLDDELDDVLRGAIYLTSANALLQQDRAQREVLLRLRDSLFPTGQSTTQKSHREEAGQAELLKGRLTAPMRVLLKSIPSPDGTLLSTLLRYTRAAQKIGQLDEKKRLLLKGKTTDEMTFARNRWIRSVNNLITTLEQEDIESPWAGTILERVRQAEVTAERRTELEGPSSLFPPEDSEPTADDDRTN